ncbi:MAG: VWA domain-containing protein [Spirochaetales bacterium]|nr:VWA domain-containing protein [Spirochaetales bacterium]
MIINEPFMLLLNLLVLPLGLLAFYNYKSGKDNIDKAGVGEDTHELKEVFIVKNFFTYICMMFFIITISLALSDIRWGNKRIEDSRNKYELTFLLDVSRSMLAKDVKSSRLDAATEAVKYLMQNIKNADFSMIVFKGQAVRLWPATGDVNAVDLFLKNLSPGVISTAGTDISKAIQLGIDSFVLPARYKAMVLITDGENLSGDPLAAADMARKRNIPIITILMATEIGTDIRLDNGEYIVNAQGRRVYSSPDMKMVKGIARNSQGKLYDYNNYKNISKDLLGILTGFDDVNLGKGLQAVKEEAYPFFVLFGCFFLVLMLIVRVWPWQKK